VLSEGPGRDRPPIDGDEQAVRRRRRHARSSQGAEHSATGEGGGDRERRRQESRPKHPCGGVLEVVRRRIHTELSALRFDAQGDLRASEVEALHRLEHLDLLRHRALQELAAGGSIEEQLLDLHGGAGSPRRGEPTGERPPHHRDPLAHLPVRRSGEETEAGDRGDGSQGFPSEPQRVDPLDGALRGELAGGMTLDRELELLRRNSGAIVRDFDAPESTVHDPDGDEGGARVDRILD